MFVAAHLLGPALSSGGDVLFAHSAREIARLHPEWHIAVVAPDYACDALAPFFRTVIPLPSTRSRLPLGGSRDVALTWLRRLGPAGRLVERLAPRLVHTTGDFFVDVFAASHVARRTGCHWTGVVHHLNPAPLRRRNDIVTATASFALQQLSLRALRARCERIALLNVETKDELLRRGFAPERLRIVGAGIDTARFAFAPAPEPGRRVLWVHRLEPTKGIGDLPKLALLLRPDTSIDVVGGGPAHLRARLSAELAAAGVVGRVTLHGYVDDPTLLQLYARANAFVSCSYEEGWGISLCEALSVGVPCVAYALPSYSSVFGGLIETVPIGDVAALAQCVNGVLARTETNAVRVLRSAAVAHFSFAAAGQRQARIFAELLGS